MSAYANKTQDNKSLATTDNSVKQSSSPVAQFKNNRPEAVTQRRLQAAANSSKQVQQLKAIQQLAGNRTGKPIQAKANTTSQTIKTGKTIQGKFVIQRGELDNQVADNPVLEPQPDLVQPEHDELRREDMHDVALGPEPQQVAAPQRVPDTLIDTTKPSGPENLRPDKGKMTRSQLGEYGILAGGVGSAGAGKFSTMISDTPAAALASDYLGGISGGLSALGDTISFGKNAAASLDRANDGDSKDISRMDTIASGASAVKSGATSAVSFLDAGSAAAATATTLAGGAGMVMGIFDMFSGAHGGIAANHRKHRLRENMHAGDRTLNRASQIAIASQKREEKKGLFRMGKGAVATTGGFALLIGATPVGWVMLSAAALIGAAAAVYAYYKKRKHKKEMAIDILGIREQRDRWKVRKKAVEKDISVFRRGARKKAMEAIGEDPLDTALRVNGYKDVGHCYNNFVDVASRILYNQGVVRNDPQSRALIENIGLKVSVNRKGKREPTASKIAAKLST